MNLVRIFLFSIMAMTLSACSTTNFMLAKWKDSNRSGSASQGQFKVGKPYNVAGRTYFPEESYSYDETGIASWYGPGFHGGKTANGEDYNQTELTAAHRTLQLPALVRVTNMENGRSVVVRVNDRGPFARGRIIDVSERAANLLKMKGSGTARVRVQVLAEESRLLADMARKGQSTRGYELALNDLQPAASGAAMPGPVLQRSVAGADNLLNTTGFMPVSAAPVESVQIASLKPYPGQMQPIIDNDSMVSAASSPQTVFTPSGVPGHVANGGRFYPDPVVKQYPIAPTSLYIQVGSFSNPQNAEKARATLAGVGPVRVTPIQVGGQQYFRVQVGPVQSVEGADRLLSRVINGGYPEARISVDRNSS